MDKKIGTLPVGNFKVTNSRGQAASDENEPREKSPVILGTSESLAKSRRRGLPSQIIYEGHQAPTFRVSANDSYTYQLYYTRHKSAIYICVKV